MKSPNCVRQQLLPLLTFRMALSCILVMSSSRRSACTAFHFGFAPSCHSLRTTTRSRLFGYLDDLNKDLYTPVDEPDVDITYDSTKANAASQDRYGVSDWSNYVDFDEFDGGDGQMGVAGDGKKGLDKEWTGAAQVSKSKTMSAKNAWGSTTGYAETLIDQGVEATRAQQLENWNNQLEINARKRQHKFMTDDFDQVTIGTTGNDENWRSLAKFGVERNQDFDLDEKLGAVVPGPCFESVLDFTSRINQPKVHEFMHRNSFMGFSDFRATIVPNNEGIWSITPTEGSLNGRQDTPFTLKYRPQSPGQSEAYLVIDTEDDKWTWRLIGNASM